MQGSQTVPGREGPWYPTMGPQDQQLSGDQHRLHLHHQQRSRGLHLTIPNYNDPLPNFLTLSQDFLQLLQCRRFNSSAELVSTILDVLLLAKSPNPKELSLQKLASPGRNTFLPSATACTLMTCVPTYHTQSHRTTSLPAMPSPSSKGKPSSVQPYNPVLSKTTSTRRLAFSPHLVSTHHAPAKPTLSTS